MSIIRIIFAVILLILLSITVNGQQFFKGGIVGGLNLSQIDGDQLAGYDKIGLSAGGKVEFALNSTFDMAVEFLFSQRGSRSRIIPGNFGDVQVIHLNYAELPVIVQWNDWWIEDRAFYRFHINGGLSLGRLINVRTALHSASIVDNFRDNDLSFIIGAGYSFNPHSRIGLRYTRSLTKMYKFDSNDQAQFDSLLGYFITIRTEYFF